MTFRSSSPQIDLFSSSARRPRGDAREVEQLLDQLRLPGRVVVNRLQRAGGDRRRPACLSAASPSSRAWRSAACADRETRSRRIHPSAGSPPPLQPAPAAPTRRDLCPVERLRAVLRDRHQQRLIFLVELHRRGEVKREHAGRLAIGKQRQRRRRDVAAVGGDRGRAPVAFLPFSE